MPSERELLSEIEQHAQVLAQAVVAAEFWHGKTLEAIERGGRARIRGMGAVEPLSR